MSQQIANINLSAAVVGQTGSIPATGILPTPPANVHQQMRPDAPGLATVVVFNESPCILLITLPNSNQSLTVPAGRWIPIPIPATETQLHWTVLSIGAGTAIFNSLLADYYNPNEPIEDLGVLGNSPVGATVSGTTQLFVVNPVGDTHHWLQCLFDGVRTLQLQPASTTIPNPLSIALQYVDAGLNAHNGLVIDGSLGGAATFSGTFVSIAGIALVGHGVPLSVAQPLDTLVNVTTPVNLATYTPTTGGQFRLGGDFTLNNNGTITAKVTYTNRNGAATTVFLTEGNVVLNAAALVAGSYAIEAISITAQANTPITVVFQDTAVGPTDHASSWIEWI